MANKRFWLGILVIVLVFGMMFVGCDDNDDIDIHDDIISGDGLWTWRLNTHDTHGEHTTASQSTGAQDGMTSHILQGNLVIQDFGSYREGSAAWQVIPNGDNLALLRTAGSISFKVMGDGKTYMLQVPTSSITDFSFYRTTFTTTNGVVQTVTIDMSDLASPGWGQARETAFNQNLITMLRFVAAAPNPTGEGPFKLEIWDLQLNQ